MLPQPLDAKESELTISVFLIHTLQIHVQHLTELSVKEGPSFMSPSLSVFMAEKTQC